MLYFLEVQGIDGRVEIRRLFPEPI
jgi:hypothetical protein